MSLGSVGGLIPLWRTIREVKPDACAHVVGLMLLAVAALGTIWQGRPPVEEYTPLWFTPVTAFVFAVAIGFFLAASLAGGRDRALLQGGITLASIAAYPFSIGIFNEPQVINVLLGGVLWTMARTSAEDRRRFWFFLRRSRGTLPGALLVGWLFVTTLTGVAPYLSLIEFVRWLTYLGIGVLFWWWAATNAHDDSMGGRLLAAWLVFVGGSIVLVGGLTFSINTWERGLLYAIRERLWLMSLHPNIAATISMLTLALVWSPAIRIHLAPWLRIGLTAALGGILAGTASRAAFLGLGLAATWEWVVVPLVNRARQQNRQNGLVVVSVSLIALLGSFAVAGLFVGNRLIRSDSFETRYVAWNIAWSTAQEYTLTGQGIFTHPQLSRYGEDLAPDHFERFKVWMGYGNRGGHAHSILFEAAQSIGLPGVLLLIWLYVAFFSRPLLRPNVNGAPARAFFGGVLLHQVFDCTFFMSGAFVLLAIALGLADPPALHEETPPTESEGRGHAFPIALTVVLLVFVLRPAVPHYVHAWYPVKSEGAVRWLQRIDPLNPKWPTALGFKAFGDDEVEAAREHYRRARFLDRKTAEHPVRLGVVAEKLGDDKAAMEHYQHAIDLDPLAVHDDEALLRRAALVRGTAEREAFIATLGDALIRSPRGVAGVSWKEPIDLRMLNRFTYVQAEDVSLMEVVNHLYAEYERLVDTDPSRAGWHIVQLQEVLWRGGKFDGLATLCLKAGLSPLTPIRTQSGFFRERPLVLTIGGGNWTPKEREARYQELIERGKEQARQDDFERSLASFIIAAEVFPERPEAYRLLAGLARARGWKNEMDYFTVLATVYASPLRSTEFREE